VPIVPAGLSRSVARVAGWASRRAGRGGGTTLPGVVLLKLRPQAVAELTPRLTRSLTISATNGKTTTARFITACVEADGQSVVANPAGSNLLRGVAAALLDANASEHATGVFEVDEAALPSVVDQLQPDVIVLMNLFRDQLDRYGELDHLATIWAEMIASLPPDTIVVANADDPTIYGLVAHRENTITFGVNDVSLARSEIQHASDASTCRSCDADLTHDVVFIGHIGHWRCTKCDLSRPEPSVVATTIELHGLDGSTVSGLTPTGPIALELSLPGLHNVYNALAAAATAHALGVINPVIAGAITDTKAAFGRAERLTLDNRELTLLLAKNPAGVNENLRTVMLDSEPLHLYIQLNDRTADGRDVSWIWDVDYEVAFDRIASVTIAGDRAHDMALRLRYGGFDTTKLTVHDSPAAGLDAALAKVPDGGRLYSLPTYTAMLELRSVLVERGVAGDFWDEA